MPSIPMPPPAPALPAVESGDVRTSYRREGDGPPVLLLAHESRDGGPAPLLATLARHFRVFAPRLAPETPPRRSALAVAGWLHDLVDALGLDRPGLVVEAEFALATLAFAMADPERVGRCVIFFPSDAGGSAQILRGCLGGTQHPLLLLGVDNAPLTGRTLGEVVRFLAGVDPGRVGADEMPEVGPGRRMT